MHNRRSIASTARFFRVVFGRRWRTFMRADELALLLLAACVGLVVGLGVAAIKAIVQLLHEEAFKLETGQSLSAQASIDPTLALAVPIAGGLVVGLMSTLIRRIRKREAVDPIEANALYGGRMSIVDSLLLTFGTMVSSGCGASVGLEAGFTQSGSGFASRLARTLRLRRADVRTLVGCGAAAAIAAAFNAPLAGAFYAFELVLGSYSVMALSPVILAALIAYLIERIWIADVDFGSVGAMSFGSPDYAVFLVIGLGAALLGIALMQAATLIETWLHKSFVPRLLRPALGGAVVGALALYSPAVLGAGHGALHVFMVERLDLSVLMLLLLAKTAAAAVSVGSGFRGGLFYTSLFVGVLFGGVCGQLYGVVAPGWASEPIVYVIVGMASVAAAVIGAPLTMVMLVLEMTRDVAITSGVIVAVVAATVLVRRLFGYSFSTWRLHLRGETIRSAFDVGWARDLTVVKLMRREARTAAETMTVAAFRKRFPIGSVERVFLLDDNQRYAGFVLVPELHAPDVDPVAETKLIKDFRQGQASYLLPRQNITKVLETFEAAEIEALPVVDDPNSLRVLGYVTEAHALKRYSQELERRRQEQSGERSPG